MTNTINNAQVRLAYGERLLTYANQCEKNKYYGDALIWINKAFLEYESIQAVYGKDNESVAKEVSAKLYICTQKADELHAIINRSKQEERDY